MKKFLLFAYTNYYPSGGWEDFNSDHDTAELAREEIKKGFTEYPWQIECAHIVSVADMKVIKSYYYERLYQNEQRWISWPDKKELK